MFGFHSFAPFLPVISDKAEFGGLWHLLHIHCFLGSMLCLPCLMSTSEKWQNCDKVLFAVISSEPGTSLIIFIEVSTG